MTLDFAIIVVLALWVFVCEKRIRKRAIELYQETLELQQRFSNNALRSF